MSAVTPPQSPAVSTNPLTGLHNETMGLSPLKAGAQNPLKTDAELKRYLAELPDITTRKAFSRWRECFLTRYEFFLGQAGTGDAEPAYRTFCSQLGRFSKVVTRVQDDLDSEKLTADQVTVSARTHLAECQKQGALTTTALANLTPATLELERELGYTKFQLGALLVRDGFGEYSHLAHADETLEEWQNSPVMAAVADRQTLDQFRQYQTKFAIFCDIMADLGLYEAMLKCHELNQLPEEPDSEPEPEPEPAADDGAGDDGGDDDSSSSSSSSDDDDDDDDEPPPPVKPKKKKAEKAEPKFNPYEFKLSFPSLKPPSGPFIKYVDTGAKTQDEVTPGVVPRGALNGSSQEMNYNHDKDNEEALFGPKAAYEPAKQMEFKMGYHGGKDTNEWRISGGQVQTTGKHQSFAKKKKSKKSKADSSDDESLGHQSTSSEESDESVRRKKEAKKKKRAQKKAAKAEQ